MSEGQKDPKIDVYETRRFSKALSRLSEDLLTIVEDEIDKIINNPEIGEQKKGDLSFLRVHKFQLNNQLTLLGYCWVEGKIELYLLNFGSHENFYQEQKRHRKTDLKLIG
ncbi:type II toxin-antitoxin system RelE/ParE family toxin [Photorhabdus noenieputensis]|uniref:type II toxin-antitoxin system RelE/ParE family toxin n=1 Tax=Photorhabdus noenieputensis TaxID=1208607 RepID=UPI001BD39CAE|nr:type II toxin-antitoxin system RelE/ParE family toxin [Photorhabdus noenieputensis]MBS9437658.1 type II toxin-antitoxin system RelE/ParE family toxin [Photorhabdus noenieputensis]MCK3670727.1 type II toxin-antitoxin system RelE/ParE family toxin [Photorhabdus noenieputensis]